MRNNALLCYLIFVYHTVVCCSYWQTPDDDKLSYNALWGKLAAEILMQNWDAALDDLNKLKDVIDSSAFSSDLQSLQQRTWFIHWSLFVFFNHPKGGDLIIDMFLVDNKHDNK